MLTMHRHRHRVIAAVSLSGLLWVVPASAQSASLKTVGDGVVRALIIGINGYENLAKLKGAVADADDLDGALRASGVTNITRLIDKQATRRAVDAAMNKLISESKSGDLVFISFAGHGAQQPELVKGSESDGMDEIFVLAGFARSGPGTAERIIDNEINAWLQALDKKGVQVVFVADTCHGGGLTRGVDLRAGELSYRTAGTITLADDDLKPISTQVDAFLKIDAFKTVTFLSAVDKFTKAPEVKIPGNATLRGALSYAVARAIEGGTEGAVTRRQLFAHARQIVYQYSETRQTITTEPERGADLDVVLFRVNGTAQQANEEPFEPIKLKIANGGENPLRGIPAARASFQVIKANESADLVWDVKQSEVVTGHGDIIVRGIAPKDIPAIIDRTAAILTVTKLSEKRTQSIALRPDNKQHRKDEQVEFVVDGTAGQYLVLFNLAGDGTVQFLYPRNQDRGGVALIEKSFRLPLRIQEPFGADHVIAIVSPQRLDGVERALLAIDGKKAAGDIAKIVAPLRKAGTRLKIGSAGLFTAP